MVSYHLHNVFVVRDKRGVMINYHVYLFDECVRCKWLEKRKWQPKLSCNILNKFCLMVVCPENCKQHVRIKSDAHAFAFPLHRDYSSNNHRKSLK